MNLKYPVFPALLVVALTGCINTKFNGDSSASLSLKSNELSPKGNGNGALKLDGLFYETAQGRVALPAELTSKASESSAGNPLVTQATMPDGRVVKLTVTADGNNFSLLLSAEPSADIVKWGFAIDARADEYFTGLIERTVDGPQQASWAAGIKPAMNLRGQKVDMILKPTTSVYAPFYISSRGYPNWGADTCGYGRAAMEQEVCARWLAFSCFNPIMEVGPTRNVAFWNLLREPKYDTTLIATWRLYARLHQRLVDYSYAHGKEASETGMPIARPLFLVDPKAPQAWDNWWTFLYGRDILVSPIWEKNKREQEVYLPSGEKWRDAWQPEKIYAGGQTIKVASEMHHIPIFIRVGATVDLGDLNKEWAESVKIAATRPDLKSLDAEAKSWLEKNK